MTDPRVPAERFAREIEAAFGDEFVAALLYGSAARGDYRPGISNVNVLVIVRDLGIDGVRRAAPAVKAWTAAGNPPPLMMSETEWRDSADVFPIEYSDIRESRVVLAGRDPVDGPRIHAEHLRLRLEHEMRSAKIQLREGYLAFGDSPDELGALLVRTVPTVLTLFRAALRLARAPVPLAPREIVEAVAARADFPAAPVLEVVERRGSSARFVVPLDGPLAAAYLHAIERATAWIDGFAHGDPDGEEV